MSWVIDAFKEIIPRGKKKMDKIEVPKKPLEPPPSPPTPPPQMQQAAPQETGGGQPEVSFEQLLIDLYNNVAEMRDDIKDTKAMLRALIK